jgi:hypothetical protein
MNKQLKSIQKTHKLQEILNVKNHKIFNCSKLTIVHEWLLKQRMAQKSRMPGDPAHRKRVLRKMSTQPVNILNFLGLLGKKVSRSKNGFLQNVNTSVRSTKDPDPPGSQQDICSLHCFCK